MDWLPLGEHSIVTGSDKVQTMILWAWGLSCSVICHVLFLEPVMLLLFVWIPEQGSKTLVPMGHHDRLDFVSSLILFTVWSVCLWHTLSLQ